MKQTEIKKAVRNRYASAALRVLDGSRASCCGPAEASSLTSCTPPTSDLYDPDQTAGVPEASVLASLGCGNPTALAELREGEVVLDLGSGGGIDVLLSARRVGPTGKAYGLDMTEEMLALAEENRKKSGLENVEFLAGDIESLPLPDESVDVIISNCVINLAVDKDRVLAEAFRVLKPGGRFAVSDIVSEGEIPEAIRRSPECWAGCTAGSLSPEEYMEKLAAAGFVDSSVSPPARDGSEPGFRSAFIRAVKPTP